MNSFTSTSSEEQNGTSKAILVGIDFASYRRSSCRLDELSGLATTAYYAPATSLTQRVNTVHPKTFIGSGKVQELEIAVRHHRPDVVIFDENLSPAQNRNLESILKCRVMDRQGLILEIFNDHARTREAKTQVELAQLKYVLPRLTRMWGHLSRQRGGIGMRDAGETQIQLDRRMIRDRISKLEKKLKQIHKEKKTQRKSRRGIFQVALVGYTNVGKSTLMNCLTGSRTLVENKLFATLDATVRKVKKNFPYPILLADTVGLIDKLPHDLVASFKSTLDEIRDAQLLLNVIDLSHPDYIKHMGTTENLLKKMGVDTTDAILVFNKLDAVKDPDVLEEARRRFPDAVLVSCRKQEGMDELRQAIVHHYEKSLIGMRLELDYDQANLIPGIRKHALIVNELYGPESMTLELRVWPERQTSLKRLLNGHNPVSIS